MRFFSGRALVLWVPVWMPLRAPIFSKRSLFIDADGDEIPSLSYEDEEDDLPPLISEEDAVQMAM